MARGEVFGLLGPNGAGKTTTVETLEGYRTPDRGTVRVLGLDPVRDAPALRPRIGVMLQEGVLYPGLKPLELLRLFAAYYDHADEPEALLDPVGLRDAAGTAVRRLSGGQIQRLWQLVRDLRDRGVTVLLTTHAMDEAEQLCDRVAIITGGKLAALGSPAELTQHAVSDEIWFAAAPGLDVSAIGRALGLGETGVVEDRAGEYVVRAAGTPERIADLACFLRDANVTLAALQAGRRSLEEVFLQITAEQAR